VARAAGATVGIIVSLLAIMALARPPAMATPAPITINVPDNSAILAKLLDKLDSLKPAPAPAAKPAAKAKAKAKPAVVYVVRPACTCAI
jgi:hypothetical protein